MQFSKVKLLDELSTKRGIMKVLELRSTTTRNGVTNYAVGPSLAEDGSWRGEHMVVEAKEIHGHVADIKEAKAKKKAIEDAAQAVVDAAKAKQRKAINLLADAIGAQKVYERYSHGDGYVPYDDKKPWVAVDYRNIEIGAEAFDELIKFLEWAGGIAGVLKPEEDE